MTTSDHRRVLGAALVAVLILLASVALAENPCADGGSPVPPRLGPGSEGGVGGTGHGPKPGEGGVGGTGWSGEPLAGDGIGGTGIDDGAVARDGIGGTGISERAFIGVVTGFASVCVGGSEIHYDAETPVRVDGRPASSDALAVGTVVEIAAAAHGSRLTANEIAVHHVVSGPIDKIEGDARRFLVLGQTIEWADDTRVSLPAGDAGVSSDSLRAGQSVEISGLRREDGTIRAFRIHPSPEAGPVAMIGIIEQIDADRAIVAGTPVELEAAASGVTAGELVRVTGDWRDERIVAARLTRHGTMADRPVLERVQIEAYVGRNVASRMRLEGVDVEVPRAVRRSLASLDTHERVLFDLRPARDGQLVTHSVRALRPPARPIRVPLDPGAKPLGSDAAGGHGAPIAGQQSGGAGHKPPPAGGMHRGGRPDVAPRRPPVMPRPPRPDLPPRPPVPPRPPRPPRLPRPPR